MINRFRGWFYAKPRPLLCAAITGLMVGAAVYLILTLGMEAQPCLVAS